jgi:endonuclease/exonuclease/phosphatase family metal-dependent hydrolase
MDPSHNLGSGGAGTGSARTRLIRVATWNVHNCRHGFDGVVRMLSGLRADVVGLQEIDRGTRRSGGRDQTAMLAQACGFAHQSFFRAIARDGGEYGVALLSRWPFSGTRIGLLPNHGDFEQRVLASVLVETPEGKLGVNVTHLSNTRTFPELRREQARAIVTRMSELDAPQVLMGDFNESPHGSAYREISRAFTDVFAAVGQGQGGTFPLLFGALQPLRLDYIFASRSLALQQARVVHGKASDHDPLVAEIWPPVRESQSFSFLA